MRPILFPRRTALLISIFTALAATEMRAQSTLIPLTARRDMVFDHAGKHLYISTSDGLVRRYDLATNQIDNSYNLGGSLNGADITSDDGFLLVAQEQIVNSHGKFQKPNLATGGITDIVYPVEPYSGEAGGYSVAIAASGIALVTTERQPQTSGGNSFPLRAINLTSDAITVRNEIAGVSDSTWINHSADGGLLYLFAGGLVTYSSHTDGFGRINGAKDWGNTAINRDQTLFARANYYYGASIDSAAGLTFQHSFRGLNAGVAFDPTRDIFYGVDNINGWIIAFDSNTYQELFRFDVGENIDTSPIPPGPFDTGRLVASPDGRYLALKTASGVRLFTIPSPPYPGPAVADYGEPRGMVFDHASHYLYVTTTTGFVLGFNIATTNLDRVYNVGGWLYGVDIAADDSFVLVAQAYPGMKQGSVQKVDLPTGSITNFNYDRIDAERGAYDLHIAANNTAFFSTSGDTVPIRQINLQTNELTPRTVPNSNWGTMDGSAQIQRSADGNLLYFLDTNSSAGITFSYNASTDTLTGVGDVRTYFDLTNAAVNRDGTLAALRYADSVVLQSGPDFHTTHSFANFTGGVAFNAKKDVLYALTTTTDEIVAYDTNTDAEVGRMWVGEDLPSTLVGRLFGVGSLAASPDGRYLALFSPTAIVLFDLQNPPPPRPNYTISLSASPSSGGIVDGGGTFPIGTNIVAKATPATGYNFANWTENGQVVSTSQWYSFTASANRQLVANFVAFPTLSIAASPIKVSKGGSAVLTVSATTMNPSQPVLVNYYTAGSAVPGTDYTLSGSINQIQITIPAGQSSATFNLNVITTKTKGSEQAIVVLGAGAGYNVAPVVKKKKPSQATVTILNK